LSLVFLKPVFLFLAHAGAAFDRKMAPRAHQQAWPRPTCAGRVPGGSMGSGTAVQSAVSTPRADADFPDVAAPRDVVRNSATRPRRKELCMGVRAPDSLLNEVRRVPRPRELSAWLSPGKPLSWPGYRKAKGPCFAVAVTLLKKLPLSIPAVSRHQGRSKLDHTNSRRPVFSAPHPALARHQMQGAADGPTEDVNLASAIWAWRGFSRGMHGSLDDSEGDWSRRTSVRLPIFRTDRLSKAHCWSSFHQNSRGRHAAPV